MLRILLLALVLLGAPAALAQPQTPTVYLNEKVRLAEVAVGQRATLRYDLTPIRGQNLKVVMFRWDQKRTDTPVKEWIFHKPAGQERLDLKGLPRAVYQLVAFACDEKGQALAYAAPLVTMEYGGWRAWEAFQPPVEVVTTPPPTFQEVDVATNIRNRDIQIAIDPPAVVVRPGGEVKLRAGFKGSEPEHLKWTLEGDGTLTTVDAYHAVYLAPAEQIGSKLMKIQIQSVSHPELIGRAMILVTSADPDTLNLAPETP